MPKLSEADDLVVRQRYRHADFLRLPNNIIGQRPFYRERSATERDHLHHDVSQFPRITRFESAP